MQGWPTPPRSLPQEVAPRRWHFWCWDVFGSRLAGQQDTVLIQLPQDREAETQSRQAWGATKGVACCPFAYWDPKTPLTE